MPNDSFYLQYLETALWSSNDNSDPNTGGDPLDKNYGPNDIAEETLAEMREDCDAFQQENAELLAQFYDAGKDEEQAGHDFWLNRNGHGSGFWDEFTHRDPPEAREVGELLSKASKKFGEYDLYVGDDGKIYGSGSSRNRHKAKLLQKRAEGDTRAAVLKALQSGPKTTGELERALGGGKYTNSAHPILKALKNEGVVKDYKMRWHLTSNLLKILSKLNNPKTSRELSVPEKHQLRIALDSMKMPDAMLGVMGGPNKEEAREIIKRLTGRDYVEPKYKGASNHMSSIPVYLRKKAEWKGWRPDMPVLVVGMAPEPETFPNLEAAKVKYPDLDPTHNGQRFTWAMHDRQDGQDVVRFDTWEQYNATSI